MAEEDHRSPCVFVCNHFHCVVLDLNSNGHAIAVSARLTAWLRFENLHDTARRQCYKPDVCLCLRQKIDTSALLVARGYSAVSRRAELADLSSRQMGLYPRHSNASSSVNKPLSD